MSCDINVVVSQPIISIDVGTCINTGSSETGLEILNGGNSSSTSKTVIDGGDSSSIGNTVLDGYYSTKYNNTI